MCPNRYEVGVYRNKPARNMIIHIQDYQKYLDSLNIIEKLVSGNNLEMLITSHEEKHIKGQDNIFRAIKYNREYIKKIKKEVDNLYKENNSIRDTAREFVGSIPKVILLIL